jgi:HEAT repeat protein
MIAPRTGRITSRSSTVLGALLTGAAYAALLAMLAGSIPALAETPEQQAWIMLRSGVRQKNTGKRVQAVRALRLLPGDSEAVEMAVTALRDRNPQVRSAAATALGLMNSKEAIPALKSTLSDKKPAVVLATIRKHDASPVRASAARALIKDSAPHVVTALVQATSDKNWMVRASALLAIAKREDPDLLPRSFREYPTRTR